MLFFFLFFFFSHDNNNNNNMLKTPGVLPSRAKESLCSNRITTDCERGYYVLETLFDEISESLQPPCWKTEEEDGEDGEEEFVDFPKLADDQMDVLTTRLADDRDYMGEVPVKTPRNDPLMHGLLASLDELEKTQKQVTELAERYRDCCEEVCGKFVRLVRRDVERYRKENNAPARRKSVVLQYMATEAEEDGRGSGDEEEEEHEFDDDDDNSFIVDDDDDSLLNEEEDDYCDNNNNNNTSRTYDRKRPAPLIPPNKIARVTRSTKSVVIEID